MIQTIPSELSIYSQKKTPIRRVLVARLKRILRKWWSFKHIVHKEKQKQKYNNQNHNFTIEMYTINTRNNNKYFFHSCHRGNYTRTICLKYQKYLKTVIRRIVSSKIWIAIISYKSSPGNVYNFVKETRKNRSR